NIEGVNVVLNAQNGVGRLSDPVKIPVSKLLAGTLTAQQARALAVATAPGEVAFYAIGPGGALRAFPYPGALPGGWKPDYLEVSPIEPLFVSATGNLNGQVSGPLFVQATGLVTPSAKDLYIGNLVVSGDAEIAAPGGIFSGKMSPTALEV